MQKVLSLTGVLPFRRRLLAFIVGAIAASGACAGDSAALTLEATLSLGDVRGRIDHLAIDIKRQRLYVAELGNNSIGVVDLKKAKVLRTIVGMREPQGIGYAAATDEVYVSNGGDGSVQRLQGETLAPAGTLQLSDDADNIRLDPAGRHVVIGYGTGALAIIDVAQRTQIADIRLRGHPESFQFAPDGQQVFVNVPDAHEIALVDLASGRQRAAWPTGALAANFPMALNPSGRELWVVFRHPSRLVQFDATTGAQQQAVETCGDSDDVFADAQRQRLYVICGSGQIDIWQQRGGKLSRLAQIATRPGARTGLYVPQLDRLFVAAPVSQAMPAALLVFRPQL